MYSINHIIKTDTRISKFELKILLQYLLAKDAVQLIIHDAYILTATEYMELGSLIQKRQNGVPLAYITGHKEFYSRDFIVNEHTLVPRPETELLVDETLKLACKNDALLDMGTGSGCIAITIKLERSDLIIDALDNYPDTLAVARLNALKLGAEIEFIQSDWFRALDKKYNIIVSNPPYIANDDSHLALLQAEPQHALSDFNDGLDCIRQIISFSKDYLVADGYVLIEHGYDQGDHVRTLFKKNHFVNIKTIQDYSMIDRVTLGQFRGEDVK